MLRVVDLGAADGVNSHGLIRDLAEERAGRPLIYALVDLPTNAWRVAADHVRDAFGWSGGPSPRWSSSPRRVTLGRGSPMRARGPLRLAGGPRRGLPASGRARPAPGDGDQPGGNSPPAGALPADG